MSPEEVLKKLNDLNPDALLLEPRAAYDKALVNVTDDPQDQWTREEKVWVAVYDYELCIEAIQTLFGEESSEDEAVEWFCFNTSGAWAGPGTPTFSSERVDPESPEEV